jgi:hypothetical protein
MYDCVGTQTSVIRTKKPSGVACRKCGAQLSVDLPSLTSRVTETLDNGYMTKAVERPADAERLYKEKADADRKGR